MPHALICIGLTIILSISSVFAGEPNPRDEAAGTKSGRIENLMVPDGEYVQFSISQAAKLAFRTLRDPSNADAVKVIYLHQLPKDIEIEDIPDSLKEEIATGKAKWVELRSSIGPQMIGHQITPIDLSQLVKEAETHRLASFRKEPIPGVKTTPERWIIFDAKQ